MKNKLSIFLFFFSIVILAQEKYSKEFSFITDNDLYVSTVNDRYYTNGMFLSYRYLSESKKENVEKKIFEWQIGHEMFTPYQSVVQDISLHDRPFAAYLFVGYGKSLVFKNDKILKTNLQLGVIGKNAYGKELQDFIHGIYGFVKAIGWKHQIKNALGLNFNVNYTDFLTKDKSNHYDISWINSAKIGTIYTNVSTGFYARLGLKSLANFANSIAFNSNLNNENTTFNRKIESFFFIKPTLKYALYDATLQGSFLNNSNEVTKELIPLVFQLEAGFKFTANRFNFGYTFNFNTNKSENLKYSNGHIYGSIGVNYLIN